MNEKQLILNKDYTVSSDGFLTLSIISAGDILDVYEYITTDGCWIPITFIQS